MNYIVEIPEQWRMDGTESVSFMAPKISIQAFVDLAAPVEKLNCLKEIG